MINLNMTKMSFAPNNQSKPDFKANNNIAFGKVIQQELGDIFERRVKNPYNSSAAIDCVYLLRKMAKTNFDEVKKFLEDLFIPKEKELDTSFSKSIIKHCEKIIDPNKK